MLRSGCNSYRLFELYGLVSVEIKDKNNDGSDEVVDEHRQHATIIEQLQRLKSMATVSVGLPGPNCCAVINVRANIDVFTKRMCRDAT